MGLQLFTEGKGDDAGQKDSPNEDNVTDRIADRRDFGAAIGGAPSRPCPSI